MRFWVIAASATMLAGCGGEGNVYDMPVGDVFEKLANLRVAPSNTSPFGRLDAVTTGSGHRVTWTARGSHASRRCVATLSPVEPARTRIDLTCGGGGAGSGAAAGLEINQTRKAVIEMIDAKLGDRPYDPQRAQGSTAASWPEDVVDHGDFGDAAAKALEMERETRAAVGQ